MRNTNTAFGFLDNEGKDESVVDQRCSGAILYRVVDVRYLFWGVVVAIVENAAGVLNSFKIVAPHVLKRDPGRNGYVGEKLGRVALVECVNIDSRADAVLGIIHTIARCSTTGESCSFVHLRY